MGRFKRKYGSFSSKDSSSSSNYSNLSNSDGNKSSQQVSSSGGNSCGSSLSGLSRNFGDKRFKLSSTSQSSSNNGSQLSEIFAKYGYTVQTKENRKSVDREGTNLKVSVTSQNSSNNYSRLLEFFDVDNTNKSSKSFSQNDQNAGITLFQHSTPKQSFSGDTSFDYPNCTESIKEHFSRLTQELFDEVDVDDDSINKEASQNDDLEYNGSSASKKFIKKSNEFEFSKNLNEHFNKDIKDLHISVSSTENEDSDFHDDSFLKEIFKINQFSKKSGNRKQKITTQSESNSSNSCISEVLIQKSDISKDLNHLPTSESNAENQDINCHDESFKINLSPENSEDIQQKIGKTQCQSNSSACTVFLKETDVFKFSKNLNDHYRNDVNNLQISGSSTKNEAINCHDDEIVKMNELPENAHNTEKTQTESNFLESNLGSQQDGLTEYSENASNFEDYLKDISFESSERIRRIHLEDFDLDVFSEDAPVTSYNFSQKNVLAEKLNNSLSSEALSTGSKSNFNDAAKRLRAGLNHISKDKSLIYAGSNVVLDVNLGSHKKDLIKRKIEEILQWFITRITEKRPLAFKVRNNKKWSNTVFQNDVLKLKPHQESGFTTIKYARRNSRHRFNLILYLFIKNYVLLQADSYATQREIYYQLKNFLDSQIQIRLAMNTISSMLNIEPWYFPIVSTSKGLVFGDLSIIISEEEVIRCNASGGTLIPQDVTKIREIKSKAFFILVVEKDAIFKKLLDEDIPNKLTRPFIIVTGKGFPDINTRLFLKKLWMSLRIPVFILVDADPDGINIMLTYRFGSLCMAHVSEQLALPHMRWLGVFPSEIKKLKITHQTLNNGERNKLKEMLKRPYVNEKPWLKREIEILIENDFKAGIEGAIKSLAFLTDVYLPYKFHSRDYF